MSVKINLIDTLPIFYDLVVMTVVALCASRKRKKIYMYELYERYITLSYRRSKLHSKVHFFNNNALYFNKIYF